jgi:hypothetical protein
LLRVTVTHVLTNALEIKLLLIPIKSPATQVVGTTSLFYEAAPGPYELRVIKQDPSYDPYIVNFELAIDTIGHIKTALDNRGLSQSCATTSPFSSIVPNPSGDYSYSNYQLLLAESALRSQRTYFTVPMTLTQASVVYARTSSNFLISEMQIVISGNVYLLLL